MTTDLARHIVAINHEITELRARIQLASAAAARALTHSRSGEPSANGV